MYLFFRINSKFDMKGNYEPSDSEEEYSDGEKKILENLRNRRREQSDSEEDVYGFSDEDSDGESFKKNNDDIADSDVEGQEQSDEDLPNTKAWGKKKGSYYSTDYVDQDYGGFGDDEEAALMEEEEAKNIQRRLLEQLGDDDFTLDFFTKNKEVDKEHDKEVIKSDLSQLSKRQKLQLLEKESPEFAGLIDDFKTKMTILKESLEPVLDLVKDGRLPNCSASKFVKTNYNLILNYCTNISFYLLLKSQKINIQNHPVIKRLYQYRQMLNKMEPIYLDVIKPQIDKILHAVSNNIDLHVSDIEKINKKRKCNKPLSEPGAKKLKLGNDEVEDTGVSDDEDEYKENNLGLQASHKGDESEESEFSDEDKAGKDIDDLDQPSTSQMASVEDTGDKRHITYQIAKNKGLTPHRKKEQRNPRVKHKLKYRKAKIRRKGAVRNVRTEVTKYAGEATGIKANVKKGIKIK